MKHLNNYLAHCMGLLLLLFGGEAFAQKDALDTHDLPIVEESQPRPKEEILPPTFVTEKMPLFPGCDRDSFSYSEAKQCSDKQLMDFVYKHLVYPDSAQANGTEGMVVVCFEITKEGWMTDIKLLRDVGDGTGEAALAVFYQLQKLPTPWTPAVELGKPVKMRYNMPVRFRLEHVQSE